jgi:hypothetical protein
MAEVAEDVRKELDKSEFTQLVGEDAFFETLENVETAYRATVSGSSNPS